MSLDFSQKPELTSLGRVISALQVVAAPAGVEFFLTGAAARDLMRRYAHNIEPTRQTEDVDFAVMVSDWQSFDALREALIASGEFFPCSGPVTHQLRHKSNLPLDIVPFGGIERADRTIVWPPDQSTVFDCFGAREAFAASAWVQLPECSPVRVPSIPALTILKVVAWHDRKRTHVSIPAKMLSTSCSISGPTWTVGTSTAPPRNIETCSRPTTSTTPKRVRACWVAT